MSIDSRRRVLVVDDDVSLLRVFARALETAGFRVEVARDGAEGLNRLISEPYDVVVSDVCMPHVTGLELLEAVRRLRPDVPAVLMTARLDPGAYERALELGRYGTCSSPSSSSSWQMRCGAPPSCASPGSARPVVAHGVRESVAQDGLAGLVGESSIRDSSRRDWARLVSRGSRGTRSRSTFARLSSRNGGRGGSRPERPPTRRRRA
jgi:CheY-like chemotaxis protein